MAAVLVAVLVSGSVFADVDGDGLLSAGDEPVAGAKVVWETTVWATTGADGRYTLDAPGQGIVWVRTPDGFSPEPSYETIRVPSTEVTIDLPLVRSLAAGPVTFVQSGDTHTGTVDLENTRLALEQATDLDPPPSFYSITGDITAGTHEVEFEIFEEARASLSIPFVPVVGNHDWEDGGPLYRRFFGPPQYAFDAGGVHFVVVNFNAPEDEQLGFLRADLATVPDDRTVVVFSHAPLTDALAATFAAEGVAYVFTGHEHANRIFEHGTLVEVNTETLSMGGIDFTPAGYRIVHIEDGRLEMTHHSTVRERFVSLTYPADGSCVPAGRVPLVAAAELGATAAEVTAQVDGGPTVALAPAGGWTFQGEVEVPSGAWHTVHLEARGGAFGPVTRDVEFCTLEGELTRPAALPDWPQLQGSAVHLGATADELAPPLIGAWATSVGGHLRGGSPVLAGGRLFVPVLDLADRKIGGVVALDALSGEVLWEARPGHSVHNAPAVDGDTVVFASADAVVHAVDAATGAERWQTDLGVGVERRIAWLYAAPTIAGGRVFIGYQPRVVALDLATGDVISTFQPAETIAAASYAAVAVSNGIGISAVGRGMGTIAAWDATGMAARWTLDLAASTRVHAAPVVDAGVAYIANVELHTCAVDLESGVPIWTRELYGDQEWAWWVLGTPALAEGRLFVPTPRGKLFALDSASGDVLWDASSDPGLLRAVPYKTDAAGFLAAPVVTGGIVWAGGLDGTLRALSAQNGQELWKLALGAPVLSGAVAAPPYLFVATFDGTVRALVSDPSVELPPPPEDEGCGCRVGGRGGAGGGGGLALGWIVLLGLALSRRFSA